MSEAVDKMLLKEMTDEDEDILMFDGDDDELLDGLMETQSVNEELAELFPQEEKYEEV